MAGQGMASLSALPGLGPTDRTEEQGAKVIVRTHQGETAVLTEKSMPVADHTTGSVPIRKTDAVRSGCSLEVFAGQPGPVIYIHVSQRPASHFMRW